MRHLRTILLLSFIVAVPVAAATAPPFSTQPRYLTTEGGSITFIVPNEWCPGTTCANASATIGGIVVPLNPRPQGNIFTAVAPPHAAGTVDVTLHLGTRNETSPGALHYVDLDAPVDPAMFETVLIPLIYNGAGINSEWLTEADLLNRNAEALMLLQPLTCEGCRDVVPPFREVSLSDRGNRQSGLLIFLPRELADHVRFGLKIRDRARDARSSGTELPVVREPQMLTGEIVLVNVPFNTRNRLQLRIYGIDGDTAEIPVRYEQTGGIYGFKVKLSPPVSNDAPSFASFDISSNMASMRGNTEVVLDLHDLPGRYWAFVTVTNNDTQQVTIVTPQ